jgi:hypothetical protein
MRTLSPGPTRRVRPPLRAAIVIAAVFLSTGAGLVVYFLSGIALPLGVGAALLVSGGVAIAVWRRLTPVQRATVWTRVWVGVRAGAAATVAYDVTRYVVVKAFGLSVNPFAALPLFGQLLLSHTGSTPATVATGIAYHVTNGVGFGTAYAVVLADRGMPAGIAWALVLEAAMLTFYPGWLDVRAIGELFSMTLLGHVAYGAVLGWLSRRLVVRAAAAS